MRLDDPFAAGTGFARPALRPMVDPFGRHVSYLRLSVTDRCDFRCVYCMSEDMAFLPKQDLLSLEELDRLCSAFIARGVRRLRLTGGEPLVRRGLMRLVGRLSRHLASGALDELTLTTNGSLLAKFAAELAAHGIRRVNVSLDTRDAAAFKAITRWGNLDAVLAGIAAARTAGLKVKINTVALNGINDGEIESLIRWAHGEGMDLTLIEVMPLGDASGGRLDRFMPLSAVRTRLAERFTLAETDHRTGGPARYVSVAETGAGSASSPRSRTIFAKAAIACASPAQERCSCASAMTMPPTCERRCAPTPTTGRSTAPSTARSAASPRVTIS